MLFTFTIFVLLIVSALGFRTIPTHSKVLTKALNTKAYGIPPIFDSSFIQAAAEAKPDDYVYGAVSAPDWALPVGAVLVILTAAVPILLAPGEKALDEQRENEEITNSGFNKRQNKDLR